MLVKLLPERYRKIFATKQIVSKGLSSFNITYLPVLGVHGVPRSYK